MNPSDAKTPGPRPLPKQSTDMLETIGFRIYLSFPDLLPLDEEGSAAAKKLPNI